MNYPDKIELTPGRLSDIPKRSGLIIPVDQSYSKLIKQAYDATPAIPNPEALPRFDHDWSMRQLEEYRAQKQQERREPGLLGNGRIFLNSPVYTPLIDHSQEIRPKRPTSLRERLKSAPRFQSFEKEVHTRTASTDMLRGMLIPRYFRHGIDILTQIRLIHRAHMRGNEEVIISRDQVDGLLRHRPQLNRIAGIIRSDGMLNIAIYGMGVLCASYQNTPTLLTALARKGEELFPQDTGNPIVNEDTIYYFASAFQLHLAMIHPFYDANGRTSEDVMYALWQRRPDLGHTKRYISSDGSREGDLVDKRMDIINNEASLLVKKIGLKLGVSEAGAESLTDYNRLLKILKTEYNMNPDQARSKYLRHYDSILAKEINQMSDIRCLLESDTVCQLAEQLRNASPTYTYSQPYQTV